MESRTHALRALVHARSSFGIPQFTALAFPRAFSNATMIAPSNRVDPFSGPSFPPTFLSFVLIAPCGRVLPCSAEECGRKCSSGVLISLQVFNPSAKPVTRSATGYFQVLGSLW